MKKIIRDQKMESTPEKEFIFPFDSAKVFGSQMDPEIKDALYKLINLDLELSKYREGGTELEDWYTRDYYPFEEYFKKLCEKERELDPCFETKGFAKFKKKETEGILEKAEQIMDKQEFSKDAMCKHAQYYIEYLERIIREEDVDKPRQSILITNLKDACYGPGEFQSIISWFVKKNLIDPDTFLWKDKKSGYKKLLARYLWDLKTKKYTNTLTADEILTIALSSFRVDIRLSTIQHANSISDTELPPFYK